MSPLLAIIVLQTTYLDAQSPWDSVSKAHQGFSTFGYKVQVVKIDASGKPKVVERGTLHYKRKGEVTFRYRDNEDGVDATMSRDKKGKWDNWAKDDVNSTNAANNALGYCDSIPSKWAYAPVQLLERRGTNLVDWQKGAPVQVSFRNMPCYLVQGKEGQTPLKVWIERKRLILLRVEQDFGSFKHVTAFENVKPS